MKTKKINISFSGGRTSAWMTYYMLKKYKTEWSEENKIHIGYCEEKNEIIHIIVTYANAGREHENTLKFIRDCDTFYNFHTVWLESIFYVNTIKGIIELNANNIEDIKLEDIKEGRTKDKFKIVNYEMCDREGYQMEAMIIKYGLPNIRNAHCTRETKEKPIRYYLRSRGWQKNDYHTAIGIRIDEIDRVSINKEKNKLIYPCIEKKMTKQHILTFWAINDFDLNLNEELGNCVTCFKKSLYKLNKLSKTNKDIFDWNFKIEKKYSNWIPPNRITSRIKKGIEINYKEELFYFREKKTTEDIFLLKIDKPKYDDTESCEVFTKCE